MSQPRRLIDELNDLHSDYVKRVNLAVAAGDEVLALQLAEGYDDEAILLIAERENKTHLLPLKRRNTTPDTPLRRMARRVRRAA